MASRSPLTWRLRRSFTATISSPPPVPGGHSSLPVPDNAIYHIADALTRLQAYTFPFELNPVTRAYFEQMSTLESGQTAANMKGILENPPSAEAMARLSAIPKYNATMRTTCVATRLSGGHANNALPQSATANVNCRILPSHTREETRQQLIQIFNDPKVNVRYVNDAREVVDTAPDSKGTAPYRAAARSDAAFSEGGGSRCGPVSR